MERCKTLEKRIDLFLELFKVWSLFVIAWSTALGTLVYKAPFRKDLLLFTTLGLVIFSTAWVVIFISLWKLTDKLETCKGD